MMTARRLSLLRTIAPTRAAWLALLTVCLGGLAGGERECSAASPELAAARGELERDYAEELEKLATWCDEQDLTEEAQSTRAWNRPRDPRTIYLVELPSRIGWSMPPEGAEPAVADWHTRFGELRRAHADKLFQLSRQALRQHASWLAVELILEAARQDPDHEPARRLLGYRKFRGAWRTAFERQQLAGGKVWHETFGWLPKGHVAHYEKGERFVDTRWVSAEEDAALHQDINDAWKLTTDHYTVTTNHSREAGVQLGVRLEKLYRAWHQVFMRYYASEAEIAKLLDGAAAKPIPQRRFNVTYFRDRQQYQQALEGHVPRDIVTSGIYLGDHRTAYFYANEDGKQDFSTLYHEATHQLFGESRPVARNLGRDGNFWIIEGIACYMESFRPADDEGSSDVPMTDASPKASLEAPREPTLGGRDAQRYLDARFRLLEDDFHVPLEELTAWDMGRLQREPRIAMVYSQAAGLTHFLMHYDDGRYRDSLIQYLGKIYGGQADNNTLAELTGVPNAELDQQYRDFLSEQDAKPQGQRQP